MSNILRERHIQYILDISQSNHLQIVCNLIEPYLINSPGPLRSPFSVAYLHGLQGSRLSSSVLYNVEKKH